MEYLIADIGGTNLRIGHYVTPNDIRIYREHYKAGEDFGEFVSRAILEFGILEFSLVIGAAGPVIDGVCDLTNNQLLLDETKLRETFGNQRIYLVNDLELLGYYLGDIGDKETTHLEVVTASGTGLGLTFVAFSNGGFSVHPTEYGHAGRDAPAWSLHGRGLSEIYKELSGVTLEPSEITRQSSLHSSSPDELADRAVDIFANLAIEMLKDIALQFIPERVHLGGTLFYEFENILKRRFGQISRLIEQTPVRVRVPEILFLPHDAAYHGGYAFLKLME